MSILSAEKEPLSPHMIPMTEGKAKAWIAAIPITDLGEATRRLYNGLTDLNRRALPAATRLRIAEMLRPVLDVTLKNLHSHLIYRSFPLPAKGQKIFNLTQSLLLEFVGAYQVAALDMITKNEVKSRLLQIAIYRALDYLGDVLQLSYSVYIRPRETLWHDIHHMYLLASENGIASLKFKGARRGADSIEARYVQINLLSLIKPFSLRQEESGRVAQYIEHITSLVTVTPEPEGPVGDYVHVVIMNSDEPAAIMPSSDLPHSPTVRVLNLQRVIQQLDHLIRESDDAPSSAVTLKNGLSRNLAKRIIFHLTTVRNRAHNRFPKKERIAVVMSLHDVLDAVENNEGADGSSAEDRQEEDVLFNTMLYGGEDEFGLPIEASPVQQDAAQAEAEIQLWQVMNSSVGGYGLSWQHSEVSNARVGEVVGLRDTSERNNAWMIGVIKWLEYADNKGLCCGVELLSTKVMPVTVHEVASRAITQSLPVKGLMLPSIEGIRPDPVMILPAYIFQPSDKIILDFSQRKEQVVLTVLDECLGSFAHFRFNKILEKNDADAPDEFGLLWDNL